MKPKSLLLLTMLASVALTAGAQSTVPTFSKVVLPNGISEGFFRGSAVFADINNDGYMDLIIKGRDLDGGWAPKVQIAMGSASGFSKGSTLLENMDIYESNLNVFDYNNDGNLDILLSCYGTPLLYRGGDTFTKVDNFTLEDHFSLNDDENAGEKTTERYYTGLTLTADFDLDGLQDILSKDSGGNPVLYRNNGDGTFTKMSNSNLAKVRGGTMAVGDFNNDGYPDVAVSGWSDEISNDVCVINKNNGDGTFSTVVSENIVGVEKGGIMLADLDNDGYLDLFVTGESCPEKWAKVAYVFKNNGDGTFQTKTAVNPNGACKGGVDWADLNGDGLIDIIYTGESNTSNVVVAINNGGLSFSPNELPENKVARGGAAVSAFDYNGDGIIDLAVMGYNDKSFLTKHFSVWNGAGVKANTAPAAPTGLKMLPGDGNVTFSWNAASDSESPTASLRYNLYVKLKNGKIITHVPADLATGKLHLGHVDAALTTTSYKLKINAVDIEEWGVQTIDGCKLSSLFAKVDQNTGIDDMTNAGESLFIGVKEGVITVSADAHVVITDLAGTNIMKARVKAGASVGTGLKTGVYVVKAVSGKVIAVKKVIIK